MDWALCEFHIVVFTLPFFTMMSLKSLVYGGGRDSLAAYCAWYPCKQPALKTSAGAAIESLYRRAWEIRLEDSGRIYFITGLAMRKADFHFQELL